jgi:hypothetical protein
MGQWDSGDDWLRRSRRACPDNVLRDIINDNRGDFPRSGSMIPNPPSKVTPVGAGVVKDAGSDGPAASGGTGWVDAPKVDNYRAPGIDMSL